MCVCVPLSSQSYSFGGSGDVWWCNVYDDDLMGDYCLQWPSGRPLPMNTFMLNTCVGKVFGGNLWQTANIASLRGINIGSPTIGNRLVMGEIDRHHS